MPARSRVCDAQGMPPTSLAGASRRAPNAPPVRRPTRPRQAALVSGFQRHAALNHQSMAAPVFWCSLPPPTGCRRIASMCMKARRRRRRRCRSYRAFETSVRKVPPLVHNSDCRAGRLFGSASEHPSCKNADSQGCTAQSHQRHAVPPSKLQFQHPCTKAKRRLHACVSRHMLVANAHSPVACVAAITHLGVVHDVENPSVTRWHACTYN